jgi:hypothetical protein
MRLKLFLFFAIFVFHTFSGLFSTQIVPGAERMVRIMTAGSDALMIFLALLSFFKHRSFYGVRFFVLFLVGAALTLLYNIDRMGVLAQLNGLRQPLFLFATLVVTYDIFQSDLRKWFVRYFTIFLVVFAILQFPTSLVQYLKFGAGDEVGGTYGLTGGSGYVTQLLFLIVFYLLVRYGTDAEGHRFSFTKLLLFSVLLIPCLLNETKISFLLLPGLLLLMVEPRRFYRFIPVAILGAILVYGLYYYYDQIAGGADSLFDERFLERYLVYDRRQNVDVPRIQKLVLLYHIFSKDLLAAVLGMGYGIFGGGHLIDATQLGRALSYLGGSRGLLLTMWAQGGLLAVVLMVICLFSFLKPLNRVSSATRRLGLFIAFSFLGILVYNDAVLDRVFAMIVCFMMMWVFFGGKEAEGGDDEEESEIPDGQLPHPMEHEETAHR